MKNFYILRHEVDQDTFQAAIPEVELSSMFVDGKKQEQYPALELSFSGSIPVDIVANSLGFPILSEKAKTCLKPVLEQDTDFFQLKPVFSGTHFASQNYYGINILNKTRVIDLEASELEDLGEDIILKIDKLVLLSKAIEGHHIVRMQEMRSIIVVSEEFRNLFLENKLSGLKFIPSAEFTFPWFTS